MKYANSYLVVMLIAGLPLTGGVALGHTSMTVAVDSNLLVYDGKLLFAQGTGSLTRLELASGKVLNRVVPPEGMHFSGTLLRHEMGVFMADYSRCVLLDEASLNVCWEVGNAHDAAVGTSHFVSHDGYHTVTCRDVASGEEVWSKTLHGGWSLFALGNVAVVATPLLYDEGRLRSNGKDSGARCYMKSRVHNSPNPTGASSEVDRLSLLHAQQIRHPRTRPRRVEILVITSEDTIPIVRVAAGLRYCRRTAKQATTARKAVAGSGTTRDGDASLAP